MKKAVCSVLFVLSLVSVLVLSGCGDNGNGMLSSIEIDGNKIECNMDMAEVLEAFSDYEYEYSETISCAYNGLDKIYDFVDNGFIVYTYPDGDKDYVLEVAVSSDKISQQDGKVKVGMSGDDVKALYGEDFAQQGDTMTYAVKDEQTMYFLLEDGVVTEYAISVAE